MQKQTNVDIVQQAYADFASGNIAGILEKCTDDITWGSYDNPTVPYAGTFHGKQGVSDFFTRLANEVDYLTFAPREFSSDESKNAVFVRGLHTGKVKRTGKQFSHDWLMEFYFRDGKVFRYFAFVDSRDHALAFTPASIHVTVEDEKIKTTAHV